MAKDNKAGTILAFLVGIGIGAAAVLLLAPQAGDELRDNITDAVGDSIDQLRDRTKNLARRSEKFVETAKEQVQDAADQGTDAYKQAKKAGA
jgi:gas vesicle protein